MLTSYFLCICRYRYCIARSFIFNFYYPYKKNEHAMFKTNKNAKANSLLLHHV